MTREEAIKILETGSIMPDYPHTAEMLDEALRMGAAALRAQQAHVKLDRSQREGCYTCNNTPGIMFGTVTLSVGKQFLTTEENEFRFCPHCGRPPHRGGLGGAGEEDKRWDGLR